MKFMAFHDLKATVFKVVHIHERAEGAGADEMLLTHNKQS